MGDEIDQLKSVLRSLVVSSPTQVTAISLLRDYRNMIGAPLPITRYGHRNPVEFLKDRCSDSFLFSGPSGNPVLTLIVPDKLKHIDKFVQKQKSSSGKGMPKRRSILESVVKPPKTDLIFSTFTPKAAAETTKEVKSKAPCESNFDSHNNNTVPNKPHLPSSNTNSLPNKPTIARSNSNLVLSKPNSDHNKSQIILSKPNSTNQSNSALSKPNSVHTKSNLVPSKSYITPSVYNGSNETSKNKENEKENRYKERDTEYDPGDAVKNFLRKRLPVYDSLQYLDDEEGKSPLDNDSGRHTGSSGHSAKAQQLEQLKSEVMELITSAPDGVWCTDLIRLYRERYSRELNFSRFGFTSILSLVYCLEKDVQITRPMETGDWLLQERTRASAAPPTLRPLRKRTSHLVVRTTKQTDPEEALPGIDFDPDVFPEDCMHFMESIEPLSLGDFRPGAMVEVMIGEVYSPSHFWFIRLGENYNVAMEDMMDDMTRYYNEEGRNRVLARGAVRVGHYCSSLYDKDWHRSLIVKIVDSDTVKVRHVDCGTVDTVNVCELKPLRREWARLPMQAARARLGGVRPAAAGWRWPRAAAAAFLRLVADKRLVANVVALDTRDMVAEVLLIDTSGEDDVSLGAQLIRAGHADPRPDSALWTLDVYLYPRFEALESGATPNYAEIHAYLRDGIALDYVEEYRAHVPAVLPDPPATSDSTPPPSTPDSPARSHTPRSPTPSDSNSTAPSGAFQASSDSAITASPSSSPPDLERVPDADDTAAEAEVPTRIPLLLPDSSTRPEAASSPPKIATKMEEAATRIPGESQAACRPPGLPPPPSYLSPHAPAYVPGAPYQGPSLAQQACRPPPPADYGRSPPPPYGGPAHQPGVTLSLADCETYRALSQVNPAAAHWFMVGAMGRATAMPVPPRPMNPPMHPPPLAMFPPHPQMHPPHYPMPPPHLQLHPMHPPPRIRPPPGFGP